MKIIKWKILGLTGFITLLPIVLGVMLWDSLPEIIAIHFDINNNPDNFASKGFVVFGLPCIMAALQIICCVISDFEIYRYGKNKPEFIMKWIIPVVSVGLQVITLGYSMGWNIDVRKVAMALIGGIFLLTGFYVSKLDYIKNYNVDEEKAKKINRFAGRGMSVMGIIFLVTIFLHQVASLVALLLLIPYTVITIIYALKICKKN